jgi:hypothetical protein
MKTPTPVTEKKQVEKISWGKLQRNLERYESYKEIWSKYIDEVNSVLMEYRRKKNKKPE